MSDSRSGGSSVALPVLVLLFVGATGAYYISPKLQTARPAQIDGLKGDRVEDKVSSRLWEDPWTAVRHKDAPIWPECPVVGNTSAVNKLGCFKQINSGEEIQASVDAKSRPRAKRGARNKEQRGFTWMRQDQKLTRAVRQGDYRRQQQSCTSKKDVFHILLVSTSDGALPSNRESRMRRRYAALSALDVMGYRLKESRSVRAFRFMGHLLAYELAQPSDLTTILEDEFVDAPSRCESNQGAMLVWLEDSFFYRDGPFSAQTDNFNAKPRDEGAVYRLEALLTHLEKVVRPQVEDSRSKIDLRVSMVGPQSSGTLIALQKNIDRVLGDKLEIYSNMATMPKALLTSGFERLSKRSRRVIADDFDVSKSLVRELSLRGISWDKLRSRGRILLISEWDTYYGRALPMAFAANYMDSAALKLLAQGCANKLVAKSLSKEILSDGDKLNILKECPNSWPGHLTRVSYLAGLDGQGFLDSGSSSSFVLADPVRRDQGSLASAVGLEKPEGSAQYDYLRRLAQQLSLSSLSGQYQCREVLASCVEFSKCKDNCEQLEAACRADELQCIRDSTESEVVAIGVLGSDIYDKLLLLRALRSYFPQAVFFTTDLNALYWHPYEIPWTRNLLVGAGHGLSLADQYTLDETRSLSYQRLAALPPFRDSYQTSTLYGVMLALGWQRTGDWHRRVEQTKVWEIGRSGAYPLQMVASVGESAKATIEDATPLEISRIRGIQGRTWLIPVIASFVLILAVLVFSRYFRSEGNTQRISVVEVLALLGALWGPTMLLAVPSWLTIVLGQDLMWNQEPIVLAEGISVWGSMALRLCGSFICIYFLLRSLRLLRNNQLRIDKEFCFSSSYSPRVPSSVSYLWHKHIIRGRKPMYWLPRVFGLTVVYFAVFFTLFSVLGTRSWIIRGDETRKLWLIILVFQVVSFVFLLLFTVDRVLVNDQFFRALTRLRDSQSDTSKIWPSELWANLRTPDIHQNAMAEWLTLRLVAQRTQTLSRLLVGPFVVLALIILSRSIVIDRFTLNIPLILVLSNHVLYAFLATWLLKQSAERMRRSAQEALLRLEIEIDSNEPGGSAGDFIRRLRERAGALESGAFAPIWRQPVLQAIAAPLGSVLLPYVYELMAVLG